MKHQLSHSVMFLPGLYVHIRNKRHVPETRDKKTNPTETMDRDLMTSEDCNLPGVAWPAISTAPKASGEDEAGLVPEALQVNMDRPGRKDHRDLKETKVLREFRDLLDLKATKAPKDPRASLVNLSQPLQLWHLPCPWW